MVDDPLSKFKNEKLDIWIRVYIIWMVIFPTGWKYPRLNIWLKLSMLMLMLSRSPLPLASIGSSAVRKAKKWSIKRKLYWDWLSTWTLFTRKNISSYINNICNIIMKVYYIMLYIYMKKKRTYFTESSLICFP